MNKSFKIETRARSYFSSIKPWLSAFFLYNHDDDCYEVIGRSRLNLYIDAIDFEIIACTDVRENEKEYVEHLTILQRLNKMNSVYELSIEEIGYRGRMIRRLHELESCLPSHMNHNWKY